MDVHPKLERLNTCLEIWCKITFDAKGILPKDQDPCFCFHFAFICWICIQTKHAPSSYNIILFTERENWSLQFVSKQKLIIQSSGQLILLSHIHFHYLYLYCILGMYMIGGYEPYKYSHTNKPERGIITSNIMLRN